jgi:hypothetical protein
LIVLKGLVKDGSALLRIKAIIAAFVSLGPLSEDDCDRLLTLLLQADVFVGVGDLAVLKARLGLVAVVHRREKRFGRGLAALD